MHSIKLNVFWVQIGLQKDGSLSTKTQQEYVLSPLIRLAKIQTHDCGI